MYIHDYFSVYQRNSFCGEQTVGYVNKALNIVLISATSVIGCFLKKVLFFQCTQTAWVAIFFIQYSRLLLHSSPSVWPVWWFVAHWKPQSCDLLVGATTKPQHGRPSLPLSRCGVHKTHSSTHRGQKKAQTHIDRCMYLHMHTYCRLAHMNTELWVFPTGWSALSEACAELWSKPNVFLNRGYGC